MNIFQLGEISEHKNRILDTFQTKSLTTNMKSAENGLRVVKNFVKNQ